MFCFGNAHLKDEVTPAAILFLALSENTEV